MWSKGLCGRKIMAKAKKPSAAALSLHEGTREGRDCDWGERDLELDREDLVSLSSGGLPQSSLSSLSMSAGALGC